MIDHANYCNLSNPTLPAYYANDAIGMENNLWGEFIFTSGLGIPTYAMSTVNLEADTALRYARLGRDPRCPGPHVLRAVTGIRSPRVQLHELRLRRPGHRPLAERSLG